MRTANKILLGAAALFLLTGVAAVGAEQFTDVSDDNIFSEDIQWMADNGITRGCNPPLNDRYCPDDNVTRGQMAAFFHRFADTVAGAEGPEGPEGPKGDPGEDGEDGVPVIVSDPADGVIDDSLSPGYSGASATRSLDLGEGTWQVSASGGIQDDGSATAQNCGLRVDDYLIAKSQLTSDNEEDTVGFGLTGVVEGPATVELVCYGGNPFDTSMSAVGPATN